jgi:SH3-like domain-containing protein
MRFLLIIALLASFPAFAQQGDNPFRSTAYPLPRFVTIASDEAYVRTGPGRKYPIQWVFKRDGLPIEIILEFDHWRKIKDHEGQVGWIHKSLLSGKRNGIVAAEDNVALYRKPSTEDKIIAYLEPDVIVKFKTCDKHWCELEASGFKGWMPKENLWGVYSEEIIED